VAGLVQRERVEYANELERRLAVLGGVCVELRKRDTAVEAAREALTNAPGWAIKLRAALSALDQATGEREPLPLDELARQATEAGARLKLDLVKLAKVAADPNWPPSQPEPRPIVVGSTWLETERNIQSTVVAVSQVWGVRVKRSVDGRLTRCWFGESVFRKLFTHVSDPAPEG